MPRPLSLYQTLGLPRPSKQLFRVLRGPYSQDELARKLAVMNTTVQDWEARRTDPQPQYLRALMEHYRSWTRKMGVDPLKGQWRAPGLRTGRAEPEDRPVTATAPLDTPGKSVPAISPDSPPPLREGGEKNV